MSCAVKKGLISIDDLSGDKLLIIGIFEFDYTQLENKNINGIDLFIESEKKVSDFRLSKKYLPEERFKKYNFVSIIGDTGVYELCSHQNIAYAPETDNIKSLLDMERNMTSLEKKILKRYLLYGGKIINIGKFSVKYEGGTMENGNISYTCNFHLVTSDTIALSAFKGTYPQIYERYKNEIYVFKDEFHKCIEFILNNISEGKSLRIKSYIDEHPERLEYVFKDLTPDTQEKFAADIEKYTFEQLEDFLFKTEQK